MGIGNTPVHILAAVVLINTKLYTNILKKKRRYSNICYDMPTAFRWGICNDPILFLNELSMKQQLITGYYNIEIFKFEFLLKYSTNN